MANEVWSIFSDNYLKQLKRPELLNEGPDTAFGANMVRGSENTNPWAGRNQDNAKYGQFAQRQPSTTYGAGGPSASPLAPKTGTPFASILAPGTAPASNWLATSGWDRLKGIFASQPTANVPGYQDLMKGMTGKVPFGVPEGVSELGGYSRLAEGFTPGGLLESPGAALGASAELGGDALGGTLGAPEVLSGASGGIPFAGPALSLGMDAVTGKLMKKPGSSIGGAGGAMAGGMAGSAMGAAAGPVGAAVGGIIGSILGAFGGGKLGGLVGGEGGEGGSLPMPTGTTSPQTMDEETKRKLFEQLLSSSYNSNSDYSYLGEY